MAMILVVMICFCTVMYTGYTGLMSTSPQLLFARVRQTPDLENLVIDQTPLQFLLCTGRIYASSSLACSKMYSLQQKMGPENT